MRKRLFDICLSVFCLIPLGICFIPIAILIKLDSKGPVIYKQTRVGKQGRNFTMYRFRTLKEDAHSFPKPESLLYDTRLTRMGYFMRKASLDALPQICNVLKGDMSIVGPRPAKPSQVIEDDPLWHLILQVRPGIISPSFLRYGINHIELQERLKADLECLKKQSLRDDLLLALQAFKVRAKAPLKGSRM